MIRKVLFLFIAAAAVLCAANFRLYMKDGAYEVVKEYKLAGDRVSFYSVDRSEWEEVPAALVDVKRTEAEAASRKETIDKAAKEISDEDAAARELQKEILQIPQDAGVYSLENGTLRIFRLADAYVHNAKGRNLLSAMSPIPMIPGKATLEIAETHSMAIVKDPRPTFYFQQGINGAQFGIVKLTPKGGTVRVVEQITIMPVVKESAEERQSVEVFTKQLTDGGLFKVWPQEPLAKGEYAFVEYTEGKINARVWDFRIE